MIPRYTMGPPGVAPSLLWPVYLNWGGCDMADEWVYRATRHFWGLTANAKLNFSVTTILPPLMPNYYTRIDFRPEAGIPWRNNVRGHAGPGPYRTTVLLQSASAEVACGGGATAEQVGSWAAHEAGHLFSELPGHENTPNNIMGEPVPLVGQWSGKYRNAINANVADIKAGWRCGYNESTARVERFNIITGEIA